MGQIIKYLRPYKSRIVMVVIVSLLLSLLTLSSAWMMGRLTDAIFYQTKGIPLQLAWEGATQNTTKLNINVSKKTPWNQPDLAKMTALFQKNGVSVVTKNLTNSQTVELVTEVEAELAKEPLGLIRRLKKALEPEFGSVQVLLGESLEQPVKQRLLFPFVYTVYLLPPILVLVYLLTGLLRYAQSFMVGAIGQKIVMRLRNEIYENLQNLSISYFEKNKAGQTGQLISRITNDIDAIHFLFSSGIFDMMLEPLVVVLGLIWGLFLNWKLTLMFFLVFPFVVWPVDRLSRKLRQVNVEIMNKLADITSVLEETLTGIKVVKAFGMEKYEVDRFQRETRVNYQAAIRGLRIGKIFLPIIEFMVSIALALFLTYGGYLVLNGKLNPGEFFTFIFLMNFMANPIRKISGVFAQIPRTLAAADRVFELIEQKSEVNEAENPVELAEIAGRVEFKAVSFGYDVDNIVLRNINLQVKPGEVIALVGPSGAGKTTLVNLIARFYDPLTGEITIDGQRLKDLKLTSLRQKMGVVPQETMLFRGTIAENIAYGKITASREEIVAAAKAANAHDFIMQMPDGYATRVGSRGMSLSGGQRQRIAIARAILRDPAILILDEATSALDTQSEELVQEALQRLMKDRTSFVIAHRLSTIRSANRIVVMNRGEIVEVGTHEELLRQDGLYARLYQTQYRNSQEELDQ